MDTQVCVICPLAGIGLVGLGVALVDARSGLRPYILKLSYAGTPTQIFKGAIEAFIKLSNGYPTAKGSCVADIVAG